MPQDGLFFRVLRRFNIIIGTILGLSLIAVIGWHLYKTPEFRRAVIGQPIVSFPYRHPVAQPDVVIEPENYGTPDTSYGPHGNTVLVLNRFAPFPTAAMPSDFEGYTPKRAINIMVLDEKAGTGHWLFATNKQFIALRDALYQGPVVTHTTPATDTRPLLGMVMEVAPDAEKPGVSKPEAIYAWTKRLGEAKKLLDVDAMISVDQTAEDRYVVIYRKGKAIKSATYSVPDFKLLSEGDLPAAPK